MVGLGEGRCCSLCADGSTKAVLTADAGGHWRRHEERAMKRRQAKNMNMLGHELDILMGERQILLKVVGATAALIAALDSRVLPASAVESADLVATALNTLPEETLSDALAAVRAEIEEEGTLVGG